MKDWLQIYKEQGVVQEKPSRQIVDLVPLLRASGVVNILDNGCGTGRHVKFFDEQGFNVVGIDNSREAIEIAKNNLSQSSRAKLLVSDISAIPFTNNSFDAIICSQVIQHPLKEDREAAISEIKRTLRSGGILFLRTISRKQKVFGLGEKIEPFTYINIPGLPDGQNPHHYFSESELRDYFDDFNILGLKEISHPPVKGNLWTHGLEELVLLAIKC